MFVTKSKLNYLIERQDDSISELKMKYWDLLDKHNTLLVHLGLTEVKLPARTELRSKVGSS